MCFSFTTPVNIYAADGGGLPGSGTDPNPSGGGLPGSGENPNGGGPAGSENGTTIWILNPLKIDTVEGLIDLVLNWLLMIAIPLSTIVILYGAMFFMIYGSIPAKRKKARDVILYAVIGIVILLLAKGISYSIMNFLTP